MATTRIELPEGTTLLAFTTLTAKPGCAVVIASRDRDEWVTWSIFVSREEDDLWDNCQWGHYFDDVDAAWADYAKRAEGDDIVRLKRV